MARKAQKRQARKILLIICEGETEQTYFECIKRKNKLIGVDIVSKKEIGGNAPKNILGYAKCEGVDYDQIFCVFDKDDHASFLETQQAIESTRKLPIKAIVSIPCFEYWLLLHFRYECSPYANKGKKSASHCCESELKKVFPKYRKGKRSMVGVVFPELINKLDFALENAIKNQKESEYSDSKNPFTSVSELVLYLLNMRQN